jgi:hypothetical protein
MRQPSGSEPRANLQTAALLWAALPAAFLLAGVAPHLQDDFRAVGLALQGRDAVMQSGPAMPAEELAALAREFPADGLLLLYYPLAQEPEQVRQGLGALFDSRLQVYRNLLYPRPRDVRIVDSEAALLAALGAASDGPRYVVDLRQEDGPPLPTPAEGGPELALEFEHRIGGRVRHWRAAEGGR